LRTRSVGAVITELGEDVPNVVGLVYESAFAPDEGETMNGLINGGAQPPGVAPSTRSA
jgi:hypothetical protein